MAFVELFCYNCNELHDPDSFHGTSIGAGLKSNKEGQARLVPGSLVWVKTTWMAQKVRSRDRNSAPFPWKLASVLARRNGKVTVKVDGGIRVLHLNSKLECLPFESVLVDDMTELQHTHKPGILHNLKKRALMKCPYTFIGDVLISVNPLQHIEDPDIHTSNAERDWSIPLPPHPRSVAEKAFRSLLFSASQRLRLVDLDQSSNGNTTKLAPRETNLVDRTSDFAQKYGLINQSIILSGESGSGKSEASKRVLKQLLERELVGLQLENEEEEEDEQEFQDRLMGSTKLLESFGNASTIRNHNSSRFGSFLKLNYQPVFPEGYGNPSFFTYGASFTTYLLERSRVTDTNRRERNFHIFYQLLSTPSKQLQKYLGFKSAKNTFCYISDGPFQPNDNDRVEYSKLRASLRMTDLGVHNGYIFEVLAGLLHLGNVEFEEEFTKGQHKAVIKDATVPLSSKVSSPRAKNSKSTKFKPSLSKRKKMKSNFTEMDVRPISVFTEEGTKNSFFTEFKKTSARRTTVVKKYLPFKWACKMLGVDSKEFQKLLLERKMRMGKEEYVKYFTKNMAERRRDAIVKHIYALFFDWIVDTINKGFNAEPSVDDIQSTCFIGILDIFGFEKFEHNSFETMLINFANEVLLALFVEEVIINESTLYAREGLILRGNELLGVSEQTERYRECIELFEGNPATKFPGIFGVIKSQQASVEPNDSKLLAELLKTMSKHPRIKKSHPKLQDSCFVVVHYADKVEYNVRGFLRKNDQRLPTQLLDLLVESKQRVVNQFKRVYSANMRTATSFAFKKRKKVPKKEVASNLSVCSVFQNQLQELKILLQATNCHYIRCVKPNPTLFFDKSSAFMKEQVENGSNIVPLEIVTRKFNAVEKMKSKRATTFGAKTRKNRSTYFDVNYVDEQLSNLGVYDCVNVLKSGLPTRIPYSAFTSMFAAEFSVQEIPFYRKRPTHFREKMFVSALLKIFITGNAVYKLGNTRVFFPTGELEQLQELIEDKITNFGFKAKARLKAKFISVYARRIWQIAFIAIKAQKQFLLLQDRVRATYKLQSVFRGLLLRKILSAKLVKQRGAIRIQKIWRGFSLRKKYPDIKAELEQVLIKNNLSENKKTSSSSTDFDALDLGDDLVEYVVEENQQVVKDDALLKNIESYIERRTVMNRKTAAMSSVVGKEAFQRITRLRQPTRAGTLLATKGEDWNVEVEMALFEMDGDKADPKMNPFVEDDEEESGDEYETEDEQPKDEDQKQSLPRVRPNISHQNVRVTVNKMNPEVGKRAAKGRPTVSYPVWVKMRNNLRPVNRASVVGASTTNQNQQQPQEDEEEEGSMHKRVKNIWGTELKRIRD